MWLSTLLQLIPLQLAHIGEHTIFYFWQEDELRVQSVVHAHLNPIPMGGGGGMTPLGVFFDNFFSANASAPKFCDF